jgi:hypothetical protein
MAGIVFMIIIIFIILQQIYESYNSTTSKNNVSDEETNQNKKKSVQFDEKEHVIRRVTRANISEIDIPEGRNNPWSRVLYNPNDEYSYYFYIKIKIPSLNDYENWKKIVPNLNFDPRTGELIIPSKDEASALALANLIVVNFMGQLSLDNILQKKLIQISVAKAKNHEVVQNKLREQIMDNLYGTNLELTQSSDLNTNVKQESAVENNQLIEAYTGTDYAYL